MKVIKLIILSTFLITFVFLDILFCQAGDITREKSGTLTTRVKKQIYPDDTYDFFSETTLDYGTYINESGTKVLMRAIWGFDLPTDLPAGSYAKKVELNYNGNSINYQTFILGYVESYPPDLDLDEKWNLANDAEELQYLPGANGTIRTVEITGLLEKVRNAQQAGQPKIYLSFKAGTDYMNTDLVTLTNLSIKITYEIHVTIIADNNFIDNSGAGTHGSIKVGGELKIAPYAFPKNAGQNATLEAQSSQIDNEGYQRIWHTGDAESSIWKKFVNSVEQPALPNNTNNPYSFTVNANDYSSAYQAQLRQIRVTTSGELSSSETWFTGVTLTGNVTVPTGKTLTITSDAEVNLGAYSIVSTGGTINLSPSAAINSLKARLTANTVLKGLCGTIQTAANNANNDNEIVLADGNFNENVSISNKSDLTILGGSSNFTHFGTLTLTNCDYFFGYNFGEKSVYINNASYVMLSNLSAYGTDQSTIGFYLYNTDTYNVSNLTADYSQAGISCYDGTEADISDSWLYDNLRGLQSYNGSNVSIYNSYFCGTDLDLQTYNFSSIEAGNCYFDGGTPSTSGSDISYYGNQSCPLSKANTNQQTENKNYVTITNEDKPGGLEFDRINSAYFALNKKLADAFKEKTDINKEAFSIDYEKVIEDFKEFIRNNPGSPLANIALIASAKSYRRIDDLRDKKDFAGMKIFLTEIIETKEYSSLKPQAERLMIDYYRLTGDFTEAIEKANNLIENYKEAPDYVCGVLYAKGLIFAHDLSQPENAAKCFTSIVDNYPNESIVILAENELRILGMESPGKEEQKLASAKKEGLSSSNYPNPFNPTTKISYTLPEDGKVQVKIFDVLGREVATLINVVESKGQHNIAWDGSNVSSGIYFYTITFKNQTINKKMLLIK